VFTDVEHEAEVLRAAAEHKGTAFIEIYQNCNVFNDGAFEAVRGKQRQANQIRLEHGKPIRFGLEDERARPVMEDVYRPLYLNQAPLMFTGRRTAELIKYAANAFLAMKITFINEMADLCEKAGGDVQAVARGIGLDQRIGSKFLNAGPGYGGSCFPKDALALLKTGQDHDAPLRLVEATVSVNDNRKRAMGRKVIASCGGNVRGKTIGILGLTFKPNTDDMRDAPSIAIIQTLLDAGAQVRGYDPEGMEMAKSVISGIDYAADAYDLANGADCLVLVTEWNQLRSLDLERIRQLMAAPCFVDLRNVYRASEMEKAGLVYTPIGRGADKRGAMIRLDAAQ
jgi:UDPglucose 6-dehydrogenase